MSKRRHSRPTARRRAPARPHLAANSLYRRALRYEPLEDRRLLAVVTVDTLSDTVDFNDGHTSLREAIFATNTVPGADTINFAPALTANGPATILLTQGELKITDALTINGPGASFLTINATYGVTTTTSPIPNLFNVDDGTSSLIDVSIGGLNLTSSAQSTFGSLIRSTENLTVASSTLAGNQVAGFGVNSQLGQLTITGSTISGNRATGVTTQGPGSISYSTISGNGQGGVYTRGELTVDHTTITGNTNQRAGGGIYSNPLPTSPASLTITDSSITNNTTTFSEGGGIRKRYGALTIERSNISNNKAWSAGGGMSIADGTFSVKIADSEITGNGFVNQASLQEGGGIFVTNGTIDVTIERSQISGNTAREGGGIVDGVLNQPLTINSSTIANNTATYRGAAVEGDRVFVTNSTISHNTGGQAAIDVFLGGTIKHSTITGNSGGIVSGGGRGITTLEVYSSIIVGNSNGDVNGFPRGFTSDGYNIIGNGTQAAAFNQPGDQVGVPDAMLGPLADNGGFVLPDGTHILTHALLAGSPAINAGDLSAVAGANGVPQFDERGTPFGRVFGGRIDIGAFEYQQPSDLNLVVDTLLDESDGNYSHGHLSLREAMFLADTNSGPDAAPVVNTIRFDPALTANGPATILLTKGDLEVSHGISIIGPGADLLAIDASGDDPTPGVNDARGSHIFLFKGSNLTRLIEVSISGLTLTGADAVQGGAMYATATDLTLNGVTISGNAGSNGGGGVNTSNGNLTVIDSRIADNVATSDRGSGGGIFFSNLNGRLSAKLQIRGSEVSNNSAASSGGGIYISVSSVTSSTEMLTVEDTIVTGNSAKGDGGGIRAYGNVSISNCTIANNTAVRAGGGISIGGYNLQIEKTVVSQNSATSGAGVYTNSWLSTITDSTVSANRASGIGGGIYARNSTQLSKVIIDSNSSKTWGGGVFLGSGSDPSTITASTIINNTSPSGGGLYSFNSVTIRDSRIEGNSSSQDGGGIRAQGSVVISNTIVTKNTSKNAGGGLFLDNGGKISSIENSKFAENASGAGGGVCFDGANFSILNSTFDSNSAARDGGGLAAISSSFSIQGSTFVGNSAVSNGGGVSLGANFPINATLANDTFVQNSAGLDGGGIWSHVSQTISNATIAYNTAHQYGGGVFFETGTTGIRNSIIAMNSAPAGNDLTGLVGVVFDVHFSLIGTNNNSGLTATPIGSSDSNGNLIGSHNYYLDPHFGLFGYNGGVTQTYALLPDSPAINAGDPAAMAGVNGTPANDQRGAPFTRVYGGRIDMGAVESQPNPLPGDFNLNGVVDLADYSLWSNALIKFDPRADANGDGRVNDVDLAVWRANYGRTYASVISATEALMTVVPKSVTVAPSKMMADLAVIEPVVEPDRFGIAFTPPALQMPPLANRQAGLKSSLSASEGSPSSDELLNMTAADARSDRSSSSVMAHSHERDNFDWLGDSTDSESTAVDEAFATLGAKQHFAHSL
jgi:predicted outer membrane repeat protein